ncbi:MAG: prolyl oligopeptidase family serine peptidase [Gemmatimonadota bacterium]|nr:prolyl oligopeptidase family serine peptidase [Gemmatimonadota bacterium]
MSAARSILLILAVTTSAVPAFAQELPTVPPSDYGRWESLGFGARLSPYGDWVAYPVARVNEENELRIRQVGGDSTHVVAWGSNPVFSPDGRWIAWSVGVSPDERERLQEAEESVRNSVALLDTGDWSERSFDAVSGIGFDGTGRFLALHGYEPEEPAGKGADLRVLDLTSGTETTFGNVGEFAWSDSLSFLAMAIATGEDAANGVQVYDPLEGRIRSLDVSGSAYLGLSWREGAADLAVLRSEEDASSTAPEHAVLAWRALDLGLSPPLVLTEGDGGMESGFEIVRHASPSWSDDGSMIAFGLRPDEGDDDEDEEDDEDEGGNEDDEDADTDPVGDEGGSAEAEEPDLPGVQIWHTKDVRVYPQQKVAESSDARRTHTAVWHIDRDRVVQLNGNILNRAQLMEGWAYAIERDQGPYPFGAMFGKPYVDTWRIDTSTGERTRIAERVRYLWTSPGGARFLVFDGEHYRTGDIGGEPGSGYILTESIPTVFADTAYDTPTDMLPPHGFGPGGWYEGDGTVLLYDEYDIWRVSVTGEPPVRLTDGAESGVTYRVAFIPDDDEPGLDSDEPLYLTMHDDQTERRGYARLMPNGTVETLVFDDMSFQSLARADSADVYMYRTQAFDRSPNLFVGGPELASAEQVSDTNPFMSEYAWGRSELFNFTSEQGRDLQAGILLPANYAGGPVPTIVYTYEVLTPQIHQFRRPSERDYYNFTAWTQHGYAVLLPDIVYTWREPGPSALASVRAAVAQAVELGHTDPDAVGLIGHSWGGYQATFLPTRTDIFAASVAGAPLTDFVSFMGQFHWNGGVPELSHWETGQGRMEVPFWEDPEAHRRSSPIHKVHEMETPLLMAHGNEDGVVDWDQATEFYNFARRAGKDMVLLVYEGEDHGFREEANQKDYHRRILEWFGHYLKGDPAAEWITDGVALDDLEEEKKRVATQTGSEEEGG